jgi:hypothetical protein
MPRAGYCPAGFFPSSCFSCGPPVFSTGFSVFPAIFSFRVLIPSTFQSGQNPEKAVTKAMAATTNAPVLRPVLIWAKIPIMTRIAPNAIRMFLSILPTFFCIPSPPVVIFCNTCTFHEYSISLSGRMSIRGKMNVEGTGSNFLVAKYYPVRYTLNG